MSYQCQLLHSGKKCAAFNNKKTLYQQIGLTFEEETSKMLHLEHGFVWCWNLDTLGSISEIPGKLWNVVLEKISWTDHMRNEEVLLRVNEQRNSLHEIRKWKANWIGHILQWNCLLKQVIEGKIEGETDVTRRRGRRRKKLLDDLKDRRGYSHLEEEVLDRTMWRNRFGGGFGPVVRQNTEWMNEYHTPYGISLP
jgi:hypothetical protein